MQTHRNQHRTLLTTLVFMLVVTLIASCAPATTQPGTNTTGGAQTGATDNAQSNTRPQSPPAIPQGERATVEYIYDGDTISVLIDGEEYRLRYIGVDTPEREEPFYQEAKDFNMDLVRGEEVILVKDVSENDQYGRLLRYVYLEDGTFVNAEMISNGWARLVTFPPDVAQTQYFKELHAEARDAGIGMWSRPDLVGPCDCDRNLYNCSDFDTRNEAQTCYDYCMDTVGYDVHKLDGSGQGRVCRSLP